MVALENLIIRNNGIQKYFLLKNSAAGDKMSILTNFKYCSKDGLLNVYQQWYF